MAELITCTPKYLPVEQWVEAADRAVAINPANRPQLEALARVMPSFKPTREHIAALTSKYWHTGGVSLTVSFLDISDSALQDKILQHMNAWAPRANVSFTKVASGGQVRISTVHGGPPDGGYWSYIGTDILGIAANKPTMNLDSFSLSTSDAEYRRVVRHETGHTLGFIHEHLRASLVAKIDPTKAYAFYGGPPNNWSKAQVDAQVLTPIEESSLTGTNPPDPNSIMCYQIPGSITKDGNPIAGGTDIDDTDYNFAAQLYPPGTTPTPTPTPTPGTGSPEFFTPTPYYPTPYYPLPPVYPAPPPAPPAPPAAPPAAAPALLAGDNVGIVGVVGLAAVMGMVATAGIVSVVAISKDKNS